MEGDEDGLHVVQEISCFPPIEDGEIDKHRLLNEEAEKNSVNKKKNEVHPSYLKRLQLERKILAEKEKEIKLAKKRMALQKQKMQAMQARPRGTYTKEPKDDLFMFDLGPPPPPKQKVIEVKPVKTILGFRYSQAVEEYYRGELKRFGRYTYALINEPELSIKDETVNGWFIRTFGANVLNLRAKSLPSCNPVELRLRRQLSRMRTRDEKSFLSIHRSLSRDTTVSNVLTRSQRSLQKSANTEDSAHLSDGQTEGKRSPDKTVTKETLTEISNHTAENDNLKEKSIVHDNQMSEGHSQNTTSAGSPFKHISFKLPSISIQG